MTSGEVKTTSAWMFPIRSQCCGASGSTHEQAVPQLVAHPGLGRPGQVSDTRELGVIGTKTNVINVPYNTILDFIFIV